MNQYKSIGLLLIGGLVGANVSTAYAQGNVNSNQQNEGVQSNNLADNGQSNVGNAQPGNSVYPDNHTFNNGASQTPWFNNPGIRQELQLNEQQFGRMNNAYGNSWSRYNQNVSGLDNGLPEATRLQRQQDYYNAFNRQFTQSTSGVFNDSNAQQRYNQLYLQYRGYGAFNDPAVAQELNLTPGQRQLFQQYDRDWNRNMRTWHREYVTNPDGVTQRYNTAQDDYRQQMGTALTPQQQQTWSRMTGKSYDFSPDHYYQSSQRVEPNNSRFDPQTNPQ